jgi:hypothetical protein
VRDKHFSGVIEFRSSAIRALYLAPFRASSAAWMKARTSGVSLALRHAGAYCRTGPSVIGRKVMSRRNREAAAYDPTGDTKPPDAITVRASSRR